MAMNAHFQSIDQVMEELNSNLYIADRALATVVFLAHRLRKPLFLEGEPGVGKTEVGTVMARLFNTQLIRLQCYEGLDASAALYEWNYPKQLLHIKIEEGEKRGKEEIERVIYSPEFLIKRPLLQAILSSNEKPPVLLIDEGIPLKQFNERYGRKHLNRRTVAVIMSDGWDLGAKKVLRKEMETMAHKVHAVLWLNPLAGDPEYKPLCKGMQTVLPFVDHLLPADSLQSLRRVGRALSRAMAGS